MGRNFFYQHHSPQGQPHLTSTVIIPSGLTLKIEDEGATLTGTALTDWFFLLVQYPPAIQYSYHVQAKTALTAEDGSTITDGTM